MIPAAIAGIFVVSPAAALPAFQPGYDLKCHGNMSALGGAQAHASAFAMTLHVDLDHGLFCQNSCETREKISKILPRNIIFRAVGAPLPNRLWVADTGQFSYTWAEAGAQEEKPSMRSAQGFCTKVVAVSSVDEESVKQMLPVPGSKPPIGEKLAYRPRSKGVSASEVRALVNIQNHRPVSGAMHTTLWLKGLAQFDNNLWVVTDKGQAVLTGSRRR
jgi:hypothetical protein